jgi:hypothetical protein
MGTIGGGAAAGDVNGEGGIVGGNVGGANRGS